MSDVLRGVASAHNAVNAVVQMYAELLSEMERRLKIANAQLEEARKSAYAEGLNQATLRQTIFTLEEQNAALQKTVDGLMVKNE
jgi:hypothetical protein